MFDSPPPCRILLINRERSTFASGNIAEFPYDVTAVRIAPRQWHVFRASQRRVATVVAHVGDSSIEIFVVGKHVDFGVEMRMRRLGIPGLTSSPCQSMTGSANVVATVSRV